MSSFGNILEIACDYSYFEKKLLFSLNFRKWSGKWFWFYKRSGKVLKSLSKSAARWTISKADKLKRIFNSFIKIISFVLAL